MEGLGLIFYKLKKCIMNVTVNVNVNVFFLTPSADAMANPSPAKSLGDPGITPLSPSHTQVTPLMDSLMSLISPMLY